MRVLKYLRLTRDAGDEYRDVVIVKRRASCIINAFHPNMISVTFQHSYGIFQANHRTFYILLMLEVPYDFLLYDSSQNLNWQIRPLDRDVKDVAS